MVSSMDSALQRFFDKIGFTETEAFKTTKVEKVVVNKEKATWDVYLKAPIVLPVQSVINLIELCKKGTEEVTKINIVLNYEVLSSEDLLNYFRHYLTLLIEKKPSLGSLIDNQITVDGDLITVEVISKIEADLIKDHSKKMIKWLDTYGLKGFNIEALISDEKRKKIKEEIENTKEVIIKTEPEYKTILGEEIKSKVIPISNLMGEENNVTFEAFIFGIEEFISTKNNFKILTLKISDKTDSMLAKVFLRDDDEFKRLKRELKVGNWYKIRGYTKNDTFARDLVLNIRDIMDIPSKDMARKDTAAEKRVELHTHTMMSQMDGVVPVKSLLKQAVTWGHKALAITDHNGAQSFPDAFKFVKDFNKGKEDPDKFKVIYGTELTLIDDKINIIDRPIDADLENSLYCVFDFETTGFNAGGGDQIIEVGAVLMQNGEIIDRFSELINPDRPLPPKITEITQITDAMLKGKPDEATVMKRFKDWFKDAIMVAHNAKFDCSFMEMAYNKYDLGTFNNTVIDTLELSRALEPDQFRHSLSALVRRYEVEFDENAHHRADYDAEATAKVLFKMLVKVKHRGITNVTMLNNLVSEEEIYKFGRAYHVNLLVQNKNGLKNLFKLISYANTKYLYRTPRILRSEIEKHREGLLVGSGCYNSEIFSLARSVTDDELANAINFYDYVEVQPLDNYTHLLQMGDFSSELELENHLKKIIDVTIGTGKYIVATGDVHQLSAEDKIYREIIVNQKVPGGGRHQLSKNDITSIPAQYFRTTEEMLMAFNFLDEATAKLLVVENPNKIADLVSFVDVIIDTKGIPFSPKIENSENIVREMVDQRAKELYGEVIHPLIAERMEKELNGIIGGKFDVIYLVAHKLVKKSNEDGYLVDSRGSVGSSFIAFLMGISEVNALPAHYVCPACKYTTFEDNEGNALGKTYSSGYDLPNQTCPKCQTQMNKEGQDMPFATFLGFNADKVPDIDLNFSGEYQAKAHEYTKELFGEDNVFRAGTIGTVADKTAFGFVRGYFEDRGLVKRSAEIERLALGVTGVKRSTGQHPGGIVVIPEYMDVFDFTPYQYPADDASSPWRTTHFDYHPMEEEILKLDILGHDNPTMLRMMQDLSGQDILELKPFDDPQIIGLLKSPDALGVTPEAIMCKTGTLGLPELGTKFVIQMLEDTQPTSFGELVKISGLSHGTMVWAGNQRDLITDKICEFKDIIGCRDDVMTTLMYSGMTPTEAFKISETVRKKGRFLSSDDIALMKKHELPDWYIEACDKIEYMFPKAHAVAYVMSALRIAWFKVYKPLLYYLAYFSVRCFAFEVDVLLKGKEGIKQRILELESKGFERSNKESEILDVLYLALEMTARGFNFKNINLNKSDSRNFIIDEDEKSLIIPFRALEGLGDSAAMAVVEARNVGPFISIEDVGNRGKVNSTTIDKMRSLGVFEDLPESSQLSLF